MRAREKDKRTILMETVGFSDTYSAFKKHKYVPERT